MPHTKRHSFADTKPDATTNPKSTRRMTRAEQNVEIFVSSGECFADGTMLEIVAGRSQLGKPDLLLWNNGRARIGTQILCGDRIYTAPELDPTLYRAIRLPTGARSYGSAQRLFEAIRELFIRHCGLPEREASSLAWFSIGTWLADRLPTAPNLIISGSNEEVAMNVLCLLSCVCRHALMLSELTPDSFRSLPAQPSLTLLLDQHRLRPAMERVLRASSYRGLYLPGSGGSLVDRYGPKAIFCGDNPEMDTLGRGAIQIFLPPFSLRAPALDQCVQEEIASQFQPRLLMYRLKNIPKLEEAQVDLSNLTLTMRPLARTLAMCFPGNPKLAGEVVVLLQPQDEEIRARRFLDPRCAIVEILLAATHEAKQRELIVDQLTKQINALLRTRGERVEYSAEAIGWQLRGLGLPRHTSSAGRQVILDRENSKRLHCLAQGFEMSMVRVEDCPDCNDEQSAETKYVM